MRKLVLEKLLERFVASEFLETSPEWIGLHPRLFDGELGSLELVHDVIPIVNCKHHR